MPRCMPESARRCAAPLCLNASFRSEERADLSPVRKAVSMASLFGSANGTEFIAVLNLAHDASEKLSMAEGICRELMS